MHCTVNASICKVGDYPANPESVSCVHYCLEIPRKFLEVGLQEKAKAKLSRTSESANYDVQNR